MGSGETHGDFDPVARCVRLIDGLVRLRRLRVRHLDLVRGDVDGDCFRYPSGGGETQREHAVAASQVRDDRAR